MLDRRCLDPEAHQNCVKECHVYGDLYNNENFSQNNIKARNC